MASKLAIYYTPMHFMWGVKSGATPVQHSPVGWQTVVQTGKLVWTNPTRVHFHFTERFQRVRQCFYFSSEKIAQTL